AAQHELDVLVQLTGNLAHGAGEFRVDLPDRDHADVDDGFLQLVKLAIETARDLGQLVRRQARLLRLDVTVERLELRLLDDQLAHDVHDVIELGDVDAHGLRQRAEGEV